MISVHYIDLTLSFNAQGRKRADAMHSNQLLKAFDIIIFRKIVNLLHLGN